MSHSPRRHERPSEAAALKSKSPIRVGFVIDVLRPGGGTENQLLLLLKAFDRQRVEPFVCSLRADPCIPTYDVGCPLEVLGVAKLGSPKGLSAVFAIRRWAKVRRLHLVVTFLRDANLMGTLGARLAGVPVVSSRRNFGHWHTRGELLILKALNPLARAFVANSEAIRDHTARVEGVDPGRIEVIPNAIDLRRYRPRVASESGRRRAELGLPDGFLIGCVANLRRVKAIDVLLRAYADSDLLRRDARILLIGAGPEEASLRALAAERGIEQRVHFLGSRSDVPEILAALDLGVLCSQAESSPNAVLEYLATGLPVVATDVGGNRELLGSGRAGILVPPGRTEELRAAMERLLESRELGAELGREGRLLAESAHALGAVVEHWTCFMERLAREG